MKASESFIAIAYRYFMAVAETGSARAAARQLNVAASAISRQLIMLEAQVGIALFDRSGRNLELSPAGDVLLRGLRAALHARGAVTAAHAVLHARLRAALRARSHVAAHLARLSERGGREAEGESDCDCDLVELVHDIVLCNGVMEVYLGCPARFDPGGFGLSK